MNNYNSIDKNDKEIMKLYLDTLLNKNYYAHGILKKLLDIGKIYIIGGAVRDIIIKNKEPRDLDIIIDCKTEDEYEIEHALQDIVYKKNRFGGYKIKLDNLEIDLWSTDNNWAFKENILENKEDNIQRSTFLDFDSPVYDLLNDSLRVDYFNSAMISSKIDITLNEKYLMRNPTPEINILRMFIIKQDWNLMFSDLVEEYIKYNIECWEENKENIISKLLCAQNKHYKSNMKISEMRLKKMLYRYTNEL